MRGPSRINRQKTVLGRTSFSRPTIRRKTADGNVLTRRGVSGAGARVPDIGGRGAAWKLPERERS